MKTNKFNLTEMSQDEILSVNGGSEFSEAVFGFLGMTSAALYSWYLGGKQPGFGFTTAKNGNPNF